MISLLGHNLFKEIYMMNTLKFNFLLLSVLLFAGVLPAQYERIPDRPSPPRLVNDFSGTLSRGDINSLERRLVRFNDTTSTQIVVVLVNSLEGYDKAQFADLLGEKWGVGQKDKDNGLVVLIKPKQGNERGQAFIATGYGLEGAVPDAVAKRIVEEEMIPEFRKNNYYTGIEKGTNTLMELTAGEYTADEYLERTRSGGGGAGFLIPFIIFIIIAAKLMSGRRRMHHYGGRRGSSLPFWTALFLANQMGGRSSGKWNDFSSGSGSFGGFGGGGSGFGGFGGGSFGGGGAGGSW